MNFLMFTIIAVVSSAVAAGLLAALIAAMQKPHRTEVADPGKAGAIHIPG